MEAKKQALVTQKRIAILENENAELKKRLRDVANIKGMHDVQGYMNANDVSRDLGARTESFERANTVSICANLL